MSIHPALIAPFMARAPRDFDLDFRHGIYRRNGLIIPSLVGVGGFTFTRASTATRVNAAGLIESVAANAPRFDYDPVSLAPRGLLIEEQRTNLLPRSEDFGSSPWNNTACASVNNAAAPDGTNTADKWTLASPGQSTVQYLIATATTNTFSVFIKKGSSANASLLLRNDSTGTNIRRVSFNLDTQTASDAGGAAGSPYSASVVDAGGGWRRLVLTITGAVAVGNTLRAYIYPCEPSGIVGNYAWLWGAQLEAGAFATSYIPTGASQATRSADVTTIPFVQKDEDFVMLVAVNMAEESTGAAARSVAQLRLDANNRWLLRLNADDTIIGIARTAATNVTFGTSTSAVTSGRAVVAMRYRAGKLSMAHKIGAATIAIGAEVATPFPSAPFSELNIGSETGSLSLNGIVERERIVSGTFDDAALANLITDMAA